jgi:hypothetical protein
VLPESLIIPFVIDWKGIMGNFEKERILGNPKVGS